MGTRVPSRPVRSGPDGELSASDVLSIEKSFFSCLRRGGRVYYMQTEVVRSPKLGYVVDFAQLIGRLTRIKKSAIQKPKHCLTLDFALLLITGLAV